MNKFQLLEKNDFSRTYRKGDILVYVAKAYDEESKLHFVVISIPEIPHLGVVKLQLPIFVHQVFIYLEEVKLGYKWGFR